MIHIEHLIQTLQTSCKIRLVSGGDQLFKSGLIFWTATSVHGLFTFDIDLLAQSAIIKISIGILEMLLNKLSIVTFDQEVDTQIVPVQFERGESHARRWYVCAPK